MLWRKVKNKLHAHIDGILHFLLFPELLGLFIQYLLGDATLVLVSTVEKDPQLLASNWKPILSNQAVLLDILDPSTVQFMRVWLASTQ